MEDVRTLNIPKASTIGVNYALPSRGVMRPRADRPRRFKITSQLTIAKAGTVETNLNNQNMKTNSNLSLANRKQLADMLKNDYDGIRGKAKQKFRKQSQELHDSILNELAEKRGATTVYQKIKAAKIQVKELEMQLSSTGFRLDGNNDLDLSDDGEELYDETIEKRIADEIGTENDIDARFDKAIVEIMTVASLEDARAILESVSQN